MSFLKVVVFMLMGCTSLQASHNENHKLTVVHAENGKEFHTGLIHKADSLKGLGEIHVEIADCEGLPEEFDLRALNVVSPIRDQGSCGSCWSFSKTGSLESAVLANGGAAVDLSEQELVACDKQNYGCQGGNLQSTEYQVSHGQGLEADFPYTSGSTGRNGSCKQIDVKAKAVQFVMAGSSNRRPNEKELKCALYKSHTVPWITVSAGNGWGGFPSTEDKAHTSCGNRGTNHAVGVVGWKKLDGKTYFIMKNSWGESWGAKGYGLLALGCDDFGEEVSYVMTNAMPCHPPVFQLPAVVEISPQVEVMIGTREVPGVDYTWYVADKQVAKGSMMYVSPAEDTIYKLVAKTSCGSAESSVKVKLVK